MNIDVNDARSDGELLTAFLKSHDQRAIKALFDRHGPMVMGVCRNILGQHDLVNDAFQATFVVLLTKAHSIGKPASLGCWLHGVACRVAKRAKSQAVSNLCEPDEIPMNSHDPSATVASKEELSVIHEEIDRLPERLRLPLILCAMEGESREEVAARLGWSVGSVKGRLERARAMLESRLKTRGVIIPTAVLSTVLTETATAQVPLALINSALTHAFLSGSGQLTSGISANLIALSDGIIKTTLISKLKLAVLCVVAPTLVGGGLFFAIHQFVPAAAGMNPATSWGGFMPFIQRMVNNPPQSYPLARSAKFEIYLVSPTPSENTTMAINPQNKEQIYLETPAVIVSSDIESVSRGEDQNKFPVLKAKMTQAGSNKLAAVTSANFNRSLAIIVGDKIVGVPMILAPISDTFELSYGGVKGKHEVFDALTTELVPYEDSVIDDSVPKASDK